MQETPPRSLNIEPAGSGVFWIRKAVPSHRSARVLLPSPWSYSPTAVHASRDLHEIARRTALVDVAGLGTGTTVQAVPSHLSARGKSVCRRGRSYQPTAMQ